MYVMLDERFRQVLAQEPRPSALRLVSWLSVVIGAKVLALFIDGYSFVMSVIFSGALLVPWAWRGLQARRFATAATGMAAFAAGIVVAYASYTAYFRTARSFMVMGPEFFRGQGVDLYAMVVPSYTFLAPLSLGWTQSVTPWQAYTDGPALWHVYLGFVLLAGLALAVGRTVRLDRPHVGGSRTGSERRHMVQTV